MGRTISPDGPGRNTSPASPIAPSGAAPEPPHEFAHMSVIIDRALGYRRTSRTSVNESSLDSTDQKMMAHCLELARAATQAGEFPFAAVISKNGEIIAETINQVAHDADITRHAELIAVSAGQKVLGRGNLKNCTLYTIVEPCPMCSFAIREARIARVVFALSSPLMGGSSRWNVLGDDVLSSHMPEVFAPPPDIVPGLLAKQAAPLWRRWTPIIWGLSRLRGVFRASAYAPPIGRARRASWRRWLGFTGIVPTAQAGMIVGQAAPGLANLAAERPVDADCVEHDDRHDR